MPMNKPSKPGMSKFRRIDPKARKAASVRNRAAARAVGAEGPKRPTPRKKK